MITRRELLPALAAALGRERLDEAQKLISSSGVESAALMVLQDRAEYVYARGKAKLDTPFLIASITKPMTVAAVLDVPGLKLDAPVKQYIPELVHDKILVRHLLTHTSGLPDMLPDNAALRQRHAPLSDFVAGACKAKLLFEPGTRVSYQSMGILLASEIAQRVTKMPFRDWLRQRVFEPLAMTDTSLGLGGRPVSAMARCEVPEVTSYDWNTAYWRDLGAPWGGAHSTVRDIARFVESFRSQRREMVTLQTAGLNEAWGLGWALNSQPNAASRFGQTCSTQTWGHFGSTGTVTWHDPAKRLTCVLLTSRPADTSRAQLLGPVSDLVARAG